ncbi:hypothetical protein [Longivirga aurantiaca]|uniref:Uncharacterized protein n=1 Tax=Longivirga aurantiaca TaxID=1837743 RepID=A0ABW1SWL1_9ACTN
MVLLVVLGLTMIGLLGVLMVAMTRHLLAHPDDAVHTHGAGSWSDGMPAAGAGTSVPDSPALLLTGATPARTGGDVPLDDMPAEVVAEAARRARESS